MISAIVAIDNNNGIGHKGKLLAKIPEDMDIFTSNTFGKIVIMGRKTYESLPNGALPDRINIVVSSKNIGVKEDGAIFMNLKQCKNFLETHQSFPIFIIGGSMIYKELLPYCEYLYLTCIKANFKKVDSYFEWDENDWKIIDSYPIISKDYLLEFFKLKRI